MMLRYYEMFFPPINHLERSETPYSRLNETIDALKKLNNDQKNTKLKEIVDKIIVQAERRPAWHPLIEESIILEQRKERLDKIHSAYIREDLAVDNLANFVLVEYQIPLNVVIFVYPLTIWGLIAPVIYMAFNEKWYPDATYLVFDVKILIIVLAISIVASLITSLFLYPLVKNAEPMYSVCDAIREAQCKEDYDAVLIAEWENGLGEQYSQPT